MESILKKAAELVTPSEEEIVAVDTLVEEVITKVNKAARSSRVYAELMIGGSVAKGSWLPGVHDLDFFFRFDFKKYTGRTDELSDLTAKVLSKVFPKVERIHGSRDYFQIKMDKVVAEIIPVLKISKTADAKNITDASPLHVDWVRKKATKNKNLKRDLRLAKMFFRSVRAYGAESFIKGFSGHVIEILTCHYGSFAKLVKSAKTWKDGQLIDVEKHHKKAEKALEALNEEKKKSPIIVIDPVDPNRNAAASLRKPVLERFVNGCESFVKKPAVKFFELPTISLDDLKKKEGKTKKLVAFEASPEEGKDDIVGSKLLKQYESVIDLFRENNFKVLECDWFWDQKDPALFCYYVDPKELSKTKIIQGPPTYGGQENILAFKKKYSRRKVWRQGYNYLVELPREFRKVEDILKAIKKDTGHSNLKLLK